MRRIFVFLLSGALGAACTERLAVSKLGLGETCSTSCDCFEPFVCDGVCTFPVHAVCVPGARVCLGNFVGVCNAAGTDYDLTDGNGHVSASGVACPVACRDGSCRETDVICTPGASLCSAGEALRCADDGLGWTDEGACEVTP